MVKMNRGGQYLKADIVKRNSILEIVDEGVWEESDQYKYDDGKPKKSFIIGVMYEGEKKLLRLNKASRVAMMEAFGDETADWIGKRARLLVMPTPQGDKKMIVLDPLKDEDVKGWET